MAHKKSTELTEVQKYYIIGHHAVVHEKQLAKELGVPITVVRKFKTELAERPKSEAPPDPFYRHKSGVTAMTEAASTAADEIRNQGVIHQSDINNAALSGDHELATKLAEMRDKKLYDHQMVLKARNANKYRPTRKGQ